MAQLFNLPIEVTFNDPQFLYLFILIPILILIYFSSMSYQKKRSINFPNFEALQRTGLTEVHSKNIYYLYLFLIITCLIILSISGVEMGIVADTSKFSYVLAIDNSESMEATDLLPNRLDMSKTAANDFISSLPLGVKVGLISFSGETEIISELENSKTKLSNSIDSIDFSDTSGTNINDAIVAGTELLKKEKMKSMIILSDGQINIGEIDHAIEYAKENNIIINTIAIGTSTGGNTTQGFTSKTDIDVLKAISFNTGGKFYSITDSENKQIPFNEILTNTRGEIKLNINNYLLITTLILIALFWISYNFRFKNFP